MTAIIALSGLVANTLLALLYASAVRKGSQDATGRAKAELALAKTAGELEAATGQIERLQGVIERYRHDLESIEEECITVGDPAIVRRRLDELLAHADSDRDTVSTGPGPLPSADPA